MKASKHTAAYTATAFLAGLSLFFLGDLKGQGDLEPPGAPEPTMKSLGQISNEIAELEEFRESSGTNVLVMHDNRAMVFTQVGNWVEQSITGTVTAVVESEGHFLLLAGNRVYGFNAGTSEWGSFNAGSEIIDATASKGTFVFTSSRKAWGWVPNLGTFEEAPTNNDIEALIGSD